MKAIHLRTEHLKNPLGIGIDKPLLTWNCQGGITQTAYEIEAVSEGAVIWHRKQTGTSAMSAVFEEPLKDRQRVEWRVRLWDENETAGEWSETASFEMGILHPSGFTAKWINPELTCDPTVHKPASCLKTTFEMVACRTARLYVTCHGLYEVYLNGQRVGNFVLAPGSFTYEKRLAVQTYDVTDLVKEGSNEVLVILGDGWYRSCTGIDGIRNLYGEDVALLFQLEADGRPVCISDESWLASQDGPIRENDMQQGEVFDARRETPADWHEVKVETFDNQNLICQDSVPIVERERFTGNIIKTPDGNTVIDYGQNLAGYVEFTVNAHEGETIVLTHGETLDENGNFTTENFQDRARHSEGEIKQKVIYICKEGLNHYKARFTIWGFRYAKVETEADLTGAVFTAIAVYSDMEETGQFECSDPDVCRLVKNSIWSMKSNFCDVPTDCPTRERAAWTGDMGVFIDAGLYLEDCYPVVRKWLAECRANQYPGGEVAMIAPRVSHISPMQRILSGSVGWGDACIIVPYALYRRYGDLRILEENYEMMKKWYGFLEKRAQQTGAVLQAEHPLANYVIDTGVDYGEWCEPDQNTDLREVMGHPQYKVATAYFARSGRMLAEIAAALGREEEAAHYREVSEKAAEAFRLTCTGQGKIHSDRQAEYVRAIAFGLLDESEEKAAAEELNRMILENGCHLNTGFLSTPMLCETLARYGYTDTTYRLLLQDTMPGWLYAVKKGATTIWECWDGIDEQGKVKNSLNHYSYGAVCDWLFGGVCGIRVEYGRHRSPDAAGQPDVRVTLRPQPDPKLSYARASYRSPLGEITSGWRYEGEDLRYEFVVPSNVVAEVTLPDGREMTLKAGEHLISALIRE